MLSNAGAVSVQAIRKKDADLVLHSLEEHTDVLPRSMKTRRMIEMVPLACVSITAWLRKDIVL